MVLLYIIIALLAIAILVLSLSLYFFIKKSTYLTNKEKEFIDFVIDMYIQYAEELEIHSKEQHAKITKQLEEIKQKHLRKNGK